VHARTVAAVALASLSFAPAALADTPAPGTLTVQGQGSVMVTPDVASLSVSVTRFASTAPPALAAVNRRVAAIAGAVRAAGVPASGIQTESVNTSCGRIRVGPKHHKRLIKRCTASESLSITSPATIVGTVIGAAIQAGAKSINGPDFSFSNPSAGKVAAEHAAITDARDQANAAAAQLGYVVTGVQSVSINPQSGVTATAAPSRTAAGAPSAPTRVHPGREEVDATVAVVFTIGPDPAQ
jgi:uncharacterized protein